MKHVADEKAHNSLYCIGGDCRCGNCLGRSTEWHNNAFVGELCSLQRISHTLFHTLV